MKTKTKTQELTLKKRAMIIALEKSLGIVTQAAKAINISRAQHYNWIKEDEEYAAAVKDIDEMALDIGETKLYEAVQAGELNAIFFFLKCKGKKRGYIERGNSEPDERVPLNIRLVPHKLADDSGVNTDGSGKND